MNFHNLLILTAPPASGKTYWITNFTKFYESQVLVLSPLRALADECKGLWGRNVRVMTPEEWKKNKFFPEVVIVDEFHLLFYWGDTFRPLLWEVFYEIALKTKLVILLTATLSSRMVSDIQAMSAHFDHIVWLDYGNQKLKFLPATYIVAPGRKWLMKQLVFRASEEKSTLIFCQFRSEVEEMEKWLSSSGFKCVSCVGGEARHMKEKFLITPVPDFIIATTVLSHGVNLPSIKRVFFLYPVENEDFWVQMVARGGRRGEVYSVFALEKPIGLPFSRVKNFLRILGLTLREKYSLNTLLHTLSRIKMRNDF